MKSAALPGGVQHAGDRGFQPLVGVRDDQLDPAQATAGQAAQELDPECSGLGGADGEAQNLAPAVCVHGNRDDDGNRTDAACWRTFT